MNGKFATVNMVSSGIHHEILRIEVGTFREGCEVQYPNLDCWQGSAVIVTFIEVVKQPAQVIERTLWPVMVINYLHLQVNLAVAIQDNVDIQNKFLRHDVITDFNWIGNDSRRNIIRVQMQQGNEQPL